MSKKAPALERFGDWTKRSAIGLAKGVGIIALAAAAGFAALAAMPSLFAVPFGSEAVASAAAGTRVDLAAGPLNGIS